MALYIEHLPRWIAACFIGWACVCFFAWCLANAAKRREECLPKTPTDYDQDLEDLCGPGEDFTLFHMVDGEHVWGEVIERHGIPLSVRYYQ